jgi:hypothetical protein
MASFSVLGPRLADPSPHTQSTGTEACRVEGTQRQRGGSEGHLRSGRRPARFWKNGGSLTQLAVRRGESGRLEAIEDDGERSPTRPQREAWLKGEGQEARDERGEGFDGPWEAWEGFFGVLYTYTSHTDFSLSFFPSVCLDRIRVRVEKRLPKLPKGRFWMVVGISGDPVGFLHSPRLSSIPHAFFQVSSGRPRSLAVFSPASGCCRRNLLENSQTRAQRPVRRGESGRLEAIQEDGERSPTRPQREA